MWVVAEYQNKRTSAAQASSVIRGEVSIISRYSHQRVLVAQYSAFTASLRLVIASLMGVAEVFEKPFIPLLSLRLHVFFFLQIKSVFLVCLLTCLISNRC